MSAHRTFNELNLKNNQYKKLAVVSAVLLLVVLAILFFELRGIKH